MKKVAKLQTMKNQLHYSWTIIHTDERSEEALLVLCGFLQVSCYLFDTCLVFSAYEPTHFDLFSYLNVYKGFPE